MYGLKENIVKGHCFKAATAIIAQTIMNDEFEYDVVATKIYTLAMKLFDGGKKAYWLTFDEYKEKQFNEDKKLGEFNDGK